MKKLVDDKTDRGFDTLERLIAKAPSETDMPAEWLDTCHTCHDTGLICTTRKFTVYSTPCTCDKAKARAEPFRYHDTDENRREFLALMKKLCTLFGKPYSQELAAAYWEQLKHHSMTDLKRALDRCAKRCKFFPKVAELVEGVYG